MYELTTHQAATTERLSAVVAFNKAVNDLERLALISDDKGADLVTDTIHLLQLPYEGTEDEDTTQVFWDTCEKEGVI